MRLESAFGALLFASLPAFAQWTDVRVPERIYSAVPFMVDVGLECPPPGEAPPPPGCRGTLGVWFETEDRSAFLPKGFVTLYPFGQPVSAGPFTFHKPGMQTLTLFAYSREFVGEIEMVGQASFVVLPPTAGAARRR